MPRGCSLTPCAATTRSCSSNTARCWPSRGRCPKELRDRLRPGAAIVRRGNDRHRGGAGPDGPHAAGGGRATGGGGIAIEVDRSAHGFTARHRDDCGLRREDGPVADRRRGVRPVRHRAEIAAQVADAGFDDLDAPIRRLNGCVHADAYSPPLEGAVVPQVDDISSGRSATCSTNEATGSRRFGGRP